MTVTVTPDDGRVRGGGASASAVVRLNTAPVVDAGPDVAAVEGSAFSSQGSVSDPDGDPITSAVVDYGDGSPPQDLDVGAGTFALSHTYADDATYAVTVTATDSHGGTTSDAAQVTVANAAPTILPVSIPAPPAEVGTPTTIHVAWTDPGAVDTHTVTVDWGDGTTSPATVDQETRTATASHIYGAAGTYVIGVTVTDDDGGADTVSQYDFGVVFDSTAGYVTANGYFDSPAGAWPSRPDATGQAEFGLNARYTEGKSVPTGKLRFTYDISPEDHGCDPATCLDLDSTDYSSLVIAGSTATLRGTGRLNGVSGHTFLVSVTDGPTDLVRVRILNRQKKVVYDSQPGAGEDAAPTIPLGGGSVLLKNTT